MNVAEGALRVVTVCAEVAAHERVGVIVDERGDPDVAAALLAVLIESIGADAAIERVGSSDLATDDRVSETVLTRMARYDVLFGVTGKSLYHSAIARSVLEAGGRVLSLTGCSARSLGAGAIEADFEGVEPLCRAFAERLSETSQLHVTSSGGVDLFARLDGRRGVANTGLARHGGERTGCLDIEAFIAPLETTVEGVAVIDASSALSGLIDEPIRLEVEHGRVVSCTGGAQAKTLQHLLEEGGDSMRTLAEFGFGLNPKADVIGDTIQDEATYGTGHIALGSNRSFYGENDAPMHLDFIYWRPNLELDGRQILAEGRLVDEGILRS